MKSSKANSLPTKGPDLLTDEMRLTRLSAGRYSHWSSGSRILACDSSAVPSMSRGLSNTIRLLSPTSSSGTSSVFRDSVRVASLPVAFRSTIFSSTELSPKPRSLRSERAAISKPFSSGVAVAAPFSVAITSAAIQTGALRSRRE